LSSVFDIEHTNIKTIYFQVSDNKDFTNMEREESGSVRELVEGHQSIGGQVGSDKLVPEKCIRTM
jgi:hypothetical protein